MKKLFFVAIGLGTVIFGGLLAYAFHVSDKTPQMYFETGKRFYDQAEFSEATIEFLNAIKKDPGHRDSHYYLALSYLIQQNLAAAVRELRTILEAHPDDVEANLRLGGIYLAGGPADPGFYHRAKEIAEGVRAGEPHNVAALILSGNASNALKDFASSAELFETAVVLEPQNVVAWIGLGTSRALLKNLPEAEKAFLKAREADTKDKNALISLANYYRVAGNPAKAEAVFDAALSQYPADREIYLQVMDFYVTARRFDEAEKTLKAAQTAKPGDPVPTIDLANFYQAQNRPEDARKLLLEAKTRFSGNVQLSIGIAENLMPDKPDQAKLEIDQVLKAEPKNAAAHVLLGEFQFNTGQFDAAEQTLGKDPALNQPVPQVHFLLGNIALKKGKVDEAEDHYQKAIQVSKAFVPARLALANGYMLKGKLDDAQAEVRQILELDRRNMPARLIKANIDSARGNYAAADAEFSSLVAEFPNNPEIHRQIGRYFASRGNNAQAEKNLARALELASTEQNFRDLTLFYLQTRQAERAREKLASIPDAQRHAFHYELLGMIAEDAGKFQESETAYKHALEKDPKWLSAETKLFNLYLRNDRFQEALKTIDDLSTKVPSNALVFAVKGVIKEKEGQSKEAEENYKQALDTDPSLNLAANNLAYLLAGEGRDLQTALTLAQGVRQRQPQDPAIADTLAWIYYKLDRLVLARDQAEFAVSKQPDNPLFAYHLGEIYRKNSQSAEAVRALKKAIGSPKDFKEKSLAEAALKDALKPPTLVRPLGARSPLR